MKRFGMIMWILFFNSCTFNVHVVKEDEDAPFKESVDALRRQESSMALVTIAGEEYPCQLVKVGEDMLTFQNRDALSEIPLKAITSITVYHGKADHPSLLAGAVIGGLTGFGVGTAVSRSTSNFRSGSGQHKLQAATAAAGALAGMLAVAGWGSNAGETYELNSRIKLCRIAHHESVTGMEAMQAGVFKNLKLGVGEQLLRVSVYQFDTDGYLIVYGTHDGMANKTHWSVVDSPYLQEQEVKMKSYSASSGSGLHLFKEQGN